MPMVIDFILVSSHTISVHTVRTLHYTMYGFQPKVLEPAETGPPSYTHDWDSDYLQLHSLATELPLA